MISETKIFEVIREILRYKYWNMRTPVRQAQCFAAGAGVADTTDLEDFCRRATKSMIDWVRSTPGICDGCGEDEAPVQAYGGGKFCAACVEANEKPRGR